MRPEATLGTFDKLGEGASTSATLMSGRCPMLPSRVPLDRAKNNFSNVNRYKFKIIVNASSVRLNRVNFQRKSILARPSDRFYLVPI